MFFHIVDNAGAVAVRFDLSCLNLTAVVKMPPHNMKKNREAMRDLQGAIKVGAKILFAGGIYGKIVRIKNDVIDVEVNKSTVIQISRYSIQNVISE